MEKQENRSTAPRAAEEQSQNETFGPRNLTLSENIILSIKVLTGAGLLAGLIWALDYVIT
jgi:hypothetical protein